MLDLREQGPFCTFFISKPGKAWHSVIPSLPLHCTVQNSGLDLDEELPDEDELLVYTYPQASCKGINLYSVEYSARFFLMLSIDWMPVQTTYIHSPFIE